MSEYNDFDLHLFSIPVNTFLKSCPGIFQSSQVHFLTATFIWSSYTDADEKRQRIV